MVLVMSFSKEKIETIKNYMLKAIEMNTAHIRKGNGKEENLKEKIINNCGISTTTYYRYLKDLENKKLIEKKGGNYLLVTISKSIKIYKNVNLDETDIYVQDVEIHLSNTNDCAKRIWEYAFTEMMNNAIDHSQSDEIVVLITETALDVTISISDDGVGIFQNICNFIFEHEKKKIGLEEAREKLFFGRFTTFAERHTGEGIFFTSRMMDNFVIVSDELIFTHNPYSDFNAKTKDIFPDGDLELLKKGTYVFMRLSKETTKKPEDYFNKYAPVEEGFVKTDFVLKNIYNHGYPISRSQAKRLYNEFLKFKEITIDFQDISDIGHSFCHELFVVFPKIHSSINIEYINANSNVENMITRVLNTAKLGQ